jgi:hypothetical protein
MNLDTKWVAETGLYLLGAVCGEVDGTARDRTRCACPP